MADTAANSQLAFVEKGSGAPLVLIHAFPLSSALWQSQLEALSSTFRVICPDLPGFGKSAVFPGITVSAMAQAVKALLDDLAPRTPVRLAGLSMGGYVALEFVRQFPGSVAALGLLATRAGTDTEEGKKKRHEIAAQVRREGASAAAAGVPKLFGKTFRAARGASVEAVQASALKNPPEGIAAALEAMAARRDSRPVLGDIMCPVVIAAGGEDEVIPVSEAESMKAAIPQARLEIFQDAGHLLNLEQPERVNRLLASLA